MVTEKSMFLRMMRRLEQSDRLDPAVRAAEPVAGKLVASPGLRRFFDGDATGIPPHGVATDVPFGAWFMAIFLDLFPDVGTRRAATRLVALGVVHAAANLTATLIFLASWAARTRDRHRLGVNLARLGGALLIVGGFLGGYMRSQRRP